MKNYKLKPWLQKTLEIIICICFTLMLILGSGISEVNWVSILVIMIPAIIILINLAIIRLFGECED